MSQEEQDGIYGRLIRESKEAKKVVAALEAKVSSFGTLLTECGNTLFAVSQRSIILDAEFMRKIDRDEILSVLLELKTVRETAARLEEQIRKFD